MRSGLLLTVVFGAILWTESTAWAQRRPFPVQGLGVTAEIDRGVLQAMIEAQQAVRQKQWVPAVHAFQVILDHSEDYFLRRDFSDKSVQPGIRAQTQRILAELPAEGRAAYELQFGAEARTRLTEAIAADNLEKVAEVARRYQITAAGLDAMQLLAAVYFDHDELIEAAMIYEAMLDHPTAKPEQNALTQFRAAYVWHLAGQSERSIGLLEILKSRDDPAAWRIGAQKYSPYEKKEEASEWLSKQFGLPVIQTVKTVRDWETPRGGQTGNESAAAAYPAGGTAWTISPLQYTKFVDEEPKNLELRQAFDRLTHQIDRSLRDSNRLTQPAAIPLVVDDMVVYRTLNDVTAVDLKSGELRWRSSTCDGMLAWMFQVPPMESDKATSASPTTFTGYLRHKLFRDQLAGSLSSDGQFVYAIEGSETQFNPLRPRARQRFGGPFVASPTNKLVAYDLKSGRIAWEVGGLSGTPPAELSGIFFLGPPMVAQGRLHCLVEAKDELCLVTLIPEANTARLDSAQTLITLNPVDWIGWPRRHAGLIPAISDQIMICPTANGSIVAYDLLFRQLRWGYSYDILKNRNDDEDRQFGLPFHGISFQTDEEEGRWLDGGPIISGGRVIVTPRDSADIHCLNLVDGSVNWKNPRGTGLYVAGIYDETVYVVGRSRIVAYAMKDGREIWDEPLEIPEPSGRGVRVGPKYLLPLSTGEIVTVDLPGARILGRSQLPDGRQAGNLAIGQGTLVSCGLHDITAFHSLDEIEQRIRETIINPDNSEALALRGELRLHDGEQVIAINDLRESLAKRADPQVKRILAGTLLNLARKNRDQLLAFADELDRLADDSRQRIEFLRLYADSLSESGDRVKAIRQLFRLAEIAESDDELVTSGTGSLMSVEQSVRSQLWMIYESANANEQLLIEQEFQREIEIVTEVPAGAERMRRFIKLVSGHPAAEPILLKFVASDANPLTASEQNRVLERLTNSENPAIAGPAVGRLATRWLDANRPREARPWVEQLGRQFASQVCLDELNGEQLCEKWNSREDLRQIAIPETLWPTGQVDFERLQGPQTPVYLSVDIVSMQSRHYTGWSFELDPTNGVLLARDASLKVAWQLKLNCFQDVSRTVPCQLHVRGHRFAMSFGTWLVVLESTDVDSAPTLVLEKSLRPNSTGDWRPNEYRIERRLLPSGRRVPFDPRNPTGFLIGMTDEAVFYQLDNRLFAYDIETGQVLWSRVGTQFAKSDATVDRVLVLHTEVNDALLLRPLDGKLLQQQKGNRTEKTLWFHDTRRLTQRQEGTDQQVIEMHDYDGNKSLWKSQYPAGSLNWIIDDDDLAVLETTGKFTVLSMETGQVRVTAQIPLVRPYGFGGALAVQRYGQNFIVVAGVASKRTESLSIVTLNSDTSFTVDGHVTAVDRKTGQVAWTVPVEHQAFDVRQSPQLPILVLASHHSKTDRSPQKMTRLCALILDKNNGRQLYSTQETVLQSCPGARFIPLVEEGKLIVDFQFWSLAFTFTAAK